MADEEILTVNSSIQSKRTTKTTANNSTEVLKDGELLIVRDGTNPPNLRAGDGTTQIKNLKDMVPPIDNTLSSTSTNPVQNKVINTALSGKANSSHTHKASDITSGVIPLDRGGTGSSVSLRDAPNGAIIRKLKSNDDNELWYTETKNGALYATSENGIPVFGTLPLAQGGTGSSTSLKDAPNGAIIRKLSDDKDNQLYYTSTKSGAFYSTGANVPADFGTLPIAQGGTGATTATDARNNLGAFSKSGGTLTGNVLIKKDSNPFFKLQIADNTETGIVQVYLPKGSSTQKMAVGFGSGKSIIVDDDGCLILTAAMYGTTLPAAGKKGRIFFKKV